MTDIRRICYGDNLLVQQQTPRKKETLVVSNRGQITLPATLRKRLGIKGGDVMILEDRGDEIVLKPGVVVEIQSYSDEQIAQWDAEDTLTGQERARILERLANRT